MSSTLIWCLLGALVLYSVAATWIARAQTVRGRKLESMVETLLRNFQTIATVVAHSKEVLDNPKLKTAFSSDDEVGTFFKQLEEIQEILNELVLAPDGTETETNEQ